MNQLIKKFYLVSIVVSIIILFGMFTEFTHLEKTIKQETQKNIELERNYKASVIDSNLIWKGQMIKDAATFIGIGAEDEEILYYLQGLMTDNPSFLSIYYGTINNQFINASGWIPPASFDLRTRPWYLKAIKGKTLIYTEAFFNASGDQWILTIAQPVYNQNEQLIGVVAGDVSLQSILDIVTLSETKDKSYSFLIDSQGKILAHPNYPYELSDSTMVLKDISEILDPSLIKGEKGVSEAVVEGQKGYLAYRSINNTDFIVGSFIAITGIMNHSEQILIIFLIAAFSTFIVFLLLFVSLRRYIIKPITSLNQDILSIRVGSETEYRLNVKEKDIFYDLKQALNGLLIKNQEYFLRIKENQDTLVNKNKELEDSFILRESMLDISQSIMKTDKLEHIYDIILKNALKSINHAKLGTIMIKEGDNFKVVSHIGFDSDSIKNFSIPVQDLFFYKATEGKMDRIARIDDVRIFDSFLCVKTSENEDVFIRSTIIAPIYINQKLYGIVSLDSMDVSSFDDNDEKMMAFIQINIEIAITKHLVFEKTLYLSNFDGLTGLYNRNYFQEFFNTNREKAMRYDEQFNIVIFDINKLKYVNDNFGHLAGDTVIVEFSKLLSGVVRKSDIMARYAGDEFIGMFFNSDKNDLYERLTQFLNKMENNIIQLDYASVFCTFSFGIAEFGVDGTDLDQLLRKADERMYRFKSEYCKQYH